MASQEPESQIPSLLHEFENFMPSSPPVQGFNGVQEPNSDHSEHRGGKEELYRHDTDFHQDSHGSCVEETQFESIEIDSQAVEDPNFPAIHPNSQLCEVSVSMVPLSATSHTVPFLTRPVDNADDPAFGYTFPEAPKPSIGMFTRPPPSVPAKPQGLAEQTSGEKQLNGEYHV
jgi:hypothetical protein